MSNIKTKIKNDLWRWNYIIPFVKKHQFDGKGKGDIVKHVLRAYTDIRPIRGKGKRTVGNDTKALLGCVAVSIDKKSRFVYFLDTGKTLAVPGNILSNFTLDYDKVIHGTFKQLSEIAIGADEYGQEASAVVEGIDNLVNRIVEEIKKSDWPKELRTKRLLDFEKILNQPAKHFEEGLQRVLFFNQLLWQTRHRLNGLGRLDRILGNLYKKDIEAGILSSAEAADIVGDFLLQLSKYADYKSDALLGDIGQIIILGGLNPDGSYFCNELTEIFLKEQAKLSRPDPKTLIRVSRKMPDTLLRNAVGCLLAKTGSPLFSNDDVVVPVLQEFGMSAEDACNYCVSACWEPYIVGKSLDQNNIAIFDFFVALDEVLNSSTANSFESLFNEYISVNVRQFTSLLSELNVMKWAKDPLVSMFMDGCSEKRLDVSEGATIYNNYGITTVALSNVVDSLLNIKRLVYDSRKYTLSQLNEYRKTDFKGNEGLYTALRQGEGHFGHQDEEAISLVKRITSSVADEAVRYRNRLGGTVKFGLSSPGYNIVSRRSAADLSGRKCGMPYNTHISAMGAPYTEVVNFASSLEYDKQRFNGNVVDFFAAPDFIKNNIDKFTLFMKEAIQIGYFQMQMNAMDSKTLIDAKAHPEKYAGLIVRVWGFSAYFNELPDSYKDLLIERAKAAERNI